MVVKKFVLVFEILMIAVTTVMAQNTKYKTQIFKNTVRTLNVFVEGNERSYPAIELNSDNKICIRFDELSANASDFSYKVIHCNYDWSNSDLFANEFLDGFNDSRIDEYEYSENTKIAYVNYQILLPNNEVSLKLTGNYMVKVYENGNPENTVLTARFVIYDPRLRIDAEIIRPILADAKNNSQEIKLNINHEYVEINDPFNEIKVVIMQNNRPDRLIKDIKPAFVKNNELIYGVSGDNIMLAGNEFRTFSFINIHKLGLGVNDIQFVDTIYHVQLRLDEKRSFKRYFWDEDMNGKSFAYLENSDEPIVTADYAYVYFTLPISEPYLDGKVYLYGSFNNWEINNENHLKYDFDKQQYETKVLLKQGYYNYIYCYESNYTRQISESMLEGSHYETENDYLIYVYHRGFGDKYDKLIGYSVINSKYKE